MARRYAADAYQTFRADAARCLETALFGGEDGLDFYRAIAKNWYGHISPGGFIAFEIGETQGSAVEAILKENGYYGVSVWEDYSGLDRIVTAMKQ